MSNNPPISCLLFHHEQLQQQQPFYLIFFYEIRTNRIGINFLTRLKQAFNKNINLLIYLIIIKSLNCECTYRRETSNAATLYVVRRPLKRD